MAHVLPLRSARIPDRRRPPALRRIFARRRSRPRRAVYHYHSFQSPLEEHVNFLTHAAAALASVVAALWLIAAAIRAGDLPMFAGCAVYSAALTTVFTMSALSHLVEKPHLRYLFRMLDQASIFLLIAGSCTPFFLRFLLPNGWGWMIALVWGIALFGAWNKLRGTRVDSVSVVLYLLLGWAPVLATKPLITYFPTGCLALVVGGGVIYTSGVLFLLRDERYRFFHAVWHILVMAAAACHYAAILLYVV